MGCFVALPASASCPRCAAMTRRMSRSTQAVTLQLPNYRDHRHCAVTQAGAHGYDQSISTAVTSTSPPTLRPRSSIRPLMPTTASMTATAGCAPTTRSASRRPEEFDPFWVVTKHAHIQAVSRQNELFHNADRPTTLTNQAVEERIAQDHGRAEPGALAGADGCARSSEIPGVDAGLVHAGQSRKIRGAGARDRARHRAAHARQGRRCDFVADVALGYPLHVIMEILGVPEKDEPRMLKLTQELFGPQDPDTARIREQLTAEQFSAMMQSVVDDFGAYFGEHHRGPARATRATISPPSSPTPRSTATTCRITTRRATT